VILHDPVTRLRAVLTSDGYGNQARNWSSVTSTDFLVHWSARTVEETVGDEPRTSGTVKLFGGPDFDLEATDRIVGPDGLTYEVDGEVMRSYVRGQLHHIRAYLRRIATKD